MKKRILKSGDTVILVVSTPVGNVEEEAKIDSITKHEIIINGLSPFDKKTGKKKSTFMGSSVYIKGFEKYLLK